MSVLTIEYAILLHEPKEEHGSNTFVAIVCCIYDDRRTIVCNNFILHHSSLYLFHILLPLFYFCLFSANWAVCIIEKT